MDHFDLNLYSIIEFDVINNLRAFKLDFIFKILEISENLFLFLCDYNFFPFDATPIVQGPMGQFILLCSYSESRVIIRDGIMARAMNGAFSLAIDKYNSEDERRSFIC